MGFHVRQWAMLVVLGVAAAAPTGAQAAPVIFTGENLNTSEATRLTSFPNAMNARNNFISQLSGVGTETFESFANGAAAPFVLTFPGAGTATMTGAANIVSFPGTSTSAGRYPISGSNYVEASSSALSLAFSAPVAAFGFFATDVGDFNGQISLTLTRTSGNTVLNIPETLNNVGGSVLYFGVIDTANPFTGVIFGNSAAGTDVFGFDDMTIGSVQQVTPSVPEPSSLVMAGTAGLIGLVGYSRRSQRKACSSTS